MKRHFFLNGQYLGASIARPRHIHEEIAMPLGFHFFCPECGKLWASCPVDGQRHIVWSRTCPDHPGDQLDVAGSIWLSWEKDFVKEFPPSVIQYELLVHLRMVALEFPPGIASIASDVFKLLSTQR